MIESRRFKQRVLDHGTTAIQGFGLESGQGPEVNTRLLGAAFGPDGVLRLQYDFTESEFTVTIPWKAQVIPAPIPDECLGVVHSAPAGAPGTFLVQDRLGAAYYVFVFQLPLSPP